MASAAATVTAQPNNAACNGDAVAGRAAARVN